ncbi:MAG: molecular chaperone DnaJ [Alphaproteobacteria bacterium]|nr:molecular chaperone DnaJ [Alphaproteobacteria bacterium]
MRDYYSVLGVERGADEKTLKSAYRKLAMQYHPDRNPNNPEAEAKFKELNEAYDVLKDANNRAAYDRMGHEAFTQRQQGGGHPGGGFGFNGGGGGFADIFEEMFGDLGGRRRRGGPQRGSDLRYNMEISLEEAYTGKQATITIPTQVACESCDGSGSEGGAPPKTCPMCHGAGRVRAQQGFFTVERTCPTCQGAGQMISDPCSACSGQGRVRREKTLNVTIPPGVDDGTRIRLASEGEMGMRGAPSGDLYIFISIRQHPVFQREDADIYCEVPIPMVTAALGGSIEVPTIDGNRVKVNIPAGTQGGHQFRLRGKGMVRLHNRGAGDMFIESRVETPVKLTKRQQELLREFDEAGEAGSHPHTEGFFKKVKEFWDGLAD